MKQFRKLVVDYVLIPTLVVIGLLAIAATFIEGPALQPFLYGVF